MKTKKTKTKSLTPYQAESEIVKIADRAGLRVLVVGSDNFSEENVFEKFSEAQKERLRDIFFDLLCEDWNDKKYEAINFIKKYSGGRG